MPSSTDPPLMPPTTPRRSSSPALFLAVLALLVALPAAARAQDPPAPLGVEARDLLKGVQALGLASSANLITVYYPPEHEAKALRLRALVEQAMAFYDR